MKKKKNNFLKKFKNKFLDSLSKIKIICKENKIVLYFILGSVINGVLLRAFTVGNFYSITPLLSELLVSCIFASFYFLFKEKRRFTYLMIISILSVVACIANIIYYGYYSSFISITFISFIFTNSETGDANVLGDLLSIKYFIFIWFPIFLYIMNRKTSKGKLTYPKKTILGSIYFFIVIIFALLISTLKPIDYSRLYTQWNREYSVTRFGVYLYQLNDIFKSIESKTVSLFGSDKAYKSINDYYENNNTVRETNEMTDIFKGKNVIAIHAESMQNIVINDEINGVEITPNLNKLASEGLYFSNFYSQVSFGTSSDTEFTYATSLLPVKIGTVFNNYYNQSYITTYSLLKDQGYYTFCMHANNGDFWNRNLMYKSLGYDYFYEKSSYNIDETVGFGLSDRSFVLQSVNYIEDVANNYDKFYGTMITLSNHTPFSYNELFTDFETLFGEGYEGIKDTKLGNYFVSVHYADEQIGLLIDELEARGLLDDTIIVIYGDHDARISSSLWEKYFNYDEESGMIKTSDDEDYINVDYYTEELNRSVPFIIWSKDTKLQQEITTVMGMYDVQPTLGNMLGIYNEYALGSDIFNTLDDNIVVFPNGNFLTNYVYYYDSKEEYKPLTNTPLDDNYIETNKQIASSKLDVSNNVIIYNYFDKVLLNKKNEVEE